MKKKWIGLFTALSLAVGVCTVPPLISGAAPSEQIDLTKTCGLTVYPVDLQTADEEKQAYWEDMKTADVVVDLYRIAEAEKLSGYDTYYFQPSAGYGKLDISEYSTRQTYTAEDWERLAQEAAGITFATESAYDPVDMKAVEDTGASLTGLDAGLYLIVARGRDMEPSEYVKTVLQETSDETAGESAESSRLVTVAHSARYEYMFTPQLVALPTKPADAQGVINTASPGDWSYTMEVILKSARELRYGSLEIIKTLREYELEEGQTPEPAVFVFHVVGTLDDKIVYDAYNKISFTGPGTSGSGDAPASARLDWIPAGARAVVTEVYSGSSYELTVPGERTETIRADEAVSVEFENRYDGRRTKGHGIKNQFVYDSESGRWYSDPVQQAPGNEGLPPDTKPEYLQ